MLIVVVRVWRFWRSGVVGEGGGRDEGEGEDEDDGGTGEDDGGNGDEDWGGMLASAVVCVREMTDEVEHGDARACARASSIFLSNRSQSVTFLSPSSSMASHGSSVDCDGRRAGRNACCGASLKVENSALVGIAESFAEVGENKSPEMRGRRDVEVCIVCCARARLSWLYSK